MSRPRLSGHIRSMGVSAQRMSDGDRKVSFRRVYEQHYSRIRSYCLRRMSHADVGDATADIFAVAWRRFDEMPTGDATLPWLYGVAYRVVSDHRRGQGRRSRLSARLRGLNPTPTDAPDSQLVQRQDYELVLASLDRLRPIDQEVLRLAVWEELSHGEIAAAFNIKVETVRQRFHRAKRALLKEFESAGGTVPNPPVAQEGGEL